MFNRQSENINDSINRVAQNFNEEYELNVKEAYRQLGLDTNIRQQISQNVYRATITNTGWNNVDKYVLEATTTRTMLDFTDTRTGKKAVIKYLPVSFQISEWNSYDQLYVYLIPDKLTSFMRLTGSGGNYSE